MTLAPPVATRLPIPTLVDIARGLAPVTDPASAGLDLGIPARQSTRLLVTESYEAWLITWPPGSVIQPHDHGDSHGAFVVLTGSLLETRWHRSQPRQRTLGPGDTALVAVGVVHDVAGTGPGTATSIHVYSPPLAQMRFYDEDASTVVSVEDVEP